MEPIEVVKAIMDKNQYKNYEVLEHTQYFKTDNLLKRFIRKLLRDSSWCDFSPGGTTRIYLKETDEKDQELGNVFVAAHEASHALNYNENIKRFQILRALQNVYLFFYFAAVLMFVAFSITKFKVYETDLVEYRYWVYSLLVVAGLAFGYLHKKDEKLTDQRAMGELKHVYTEESDIKRAGQLLEKRYKERVSSILFFKVAFPVMLVIADIAVYMAKNTLMRG